MLSMEKFPERLRVRREELGFTQTKLAELVEVSTQTISAYERRGGKTEKKPSLDTAIKLAEKLGVSLDWLCGGEGAKPQELKNLADLVDYLKVISQYVRCFVGTGLRDLPEEEYYEDVDVYGGHNPQLNLITKEKTACIQISSWALANFFENRNKVYKLYLDGILAEDAYNSWYLGELSKLKEKWPLQKIPSANDDGNDFEIKE